MVKSRLLPVLAVALLSLDVRDLLARPASGAGPLLWRDPGAIESRDLFWGSGGEARKPQPPFKFREENLGGTTAKVVVEDAKGVLWDVKLAGEEAHGEVIASRLHWALGYGAQELYYVHEGTIQGAKDLKRAGKFIDPNGRFVAARFRLRDPDAKEGEGWAFNANPFTGTQELSGLIILNALINNWDTADTTNKEIVALKTPDGRAEQWYIAKDLGASFGRFQGPQGTPIKWSLRDYEKDPLVSKVEGDTLVLNYPAYGTPPTRVPLEHARWFANLIGRLSDAQLRAAFDAGGATPAETEGFVRKLKAKIEELRAAVGTSTRR